LRKERKFLMTILTKIERVAVFTMRSILSAVNGRVCTRFMANYYRRRGMKIKGLPNFLAASIWLDGSDYSLIELNEGCTLSSEVRVFTHDWSLYTIGRGMGLKIEKPIGILRPVRIGKYVFIGSGSILLPGADIGDGAIVGAGSVVRGQVAPWTIVVGSPAQPAGDSREFLCKNLSRMGLTSLLQEAQQAMGKTSGN
jgi:acetyltransferase-like isoleucine patch superfamily enzyme